MKVLKQFIAAWLKMRAALVVAVVFLALFVTFSALIGMPPFGYVVITLLVAIPSSWYLLRSMKKNDTAPSSVRMVTVMGLSVLVMFGVIQLVPYGRDHSNPPVLAEPQWANARTRELMVNACFSCHSNEVEYPSYSKVAPISWVVQSHVDEGRQRVNYSEFKEGGRGFRYTVAVIQSGYMPPGYFTRFGRHPEAKLSDAEMKELIAGLRATPGLSRTSK